MKANLVNLVQLVYCASLFGEHRRYLLPEIHVLLEVELALRR